MGSTTPPFLGIYLTTTRYCNRVYKSEDAETTSPSQTTRPTTTHDNDTTKPSIYHTLLSLYLTPPPPHPVNLPPALDLLSKHGSRLPAASTLSLVPDSLLVRDLESYFRGRMRSANSVVNEMRVVAGLAKTSLVATEARLLLGDGVPGGQAGRNRGVVISQERVCGVCHKRLGGSVTAMMPDNAVVHHGCLKRAMAGGGSGGAGSFISGAWGRSGQVGV